jgi:hypothetical protein
VKVGPWEETDGRFVRWFECTPRKAATIVVPLIKLNRRYFTIDVYRSPEGNERAWGATANAFEINYAKKIADTLLELFAAETS